MMLEYPKLSNNPVIEDQLEQLQNIQAKLSDYLLHAQTKYKKVVDRHHLDSTPKEPKF